MTWPEATLVLGTLATLVVVILVLCVVMFKLARVAQPVALSKEKTKRIDRLNPPRQNSWEREAADVLAGMGDDPSSVDRQPSPMPIGMDGA